jgi:hypothetical protein
MRSLSSKWGR